ncbi:hypothetical protein MBANPS3_001970 [Mucor bainieri]
MKLRDKRKSVLGNIKQEDCKPALTIAEPTTSTTTDTTNTVALTIKQEDTKKGESMLKQNDQYGEKDYYYRCDICKTKMANLKSVLEHRKSTHLTRTWSNRKIKNMETEPDIHDHNFYCKSCERSYKDRNKYRSHLRAVHYMILKSPPNLKAPDNDVFPDPDDPSLHCRACDHTYTRKDTYKQHCRYSHGMKHVKFASRSSASNSTTDTYCQTCDIRLSSVRSYHQHMFVVHEVEIRPPQQKRNDVLPDVNDPNFYCQSCEKKMASKCTFRAHLMLVHSIFQSASRKKSRSKPNVNDPNKYCRACQKTYPSKSRYRMHLRLVHQMALPSLKRDTNSTDLPDPYNSDHYCSVCMKTYASLTAYRYHCKLVHFMSMNHASIVNPDAEININDPDLYCAQCERSFTGNYFKKHLRVVHNIQ